MKQILKIHGTSSEITFDCEDAVIIGSGEFLARSGSIDGFAVSLASLRYEDGAFLSPEERQEIIQRYQEYLSGRKTPPTLSLEFE